MVFVPSSPGCSVRLGSLWPRNALPGRGIPSVPRHGLHTSMTLKHSFWMAEEVDLTKSPVFQRKTSRTSPISDASCCKKKTESNPDQPGLSPCFPNRWKLPDRAACRVSPAMAQRAGSPLILAVSRVSSLLGSLGLLGLHSQQCQHHQPAKRTHR